MVLPNASYSEFYCLQELRGGPLASLRLVSLRVWSAMIFKRKSSTRQEVINQFLEHLILGAASGPEQGGESTERAYAR